MKVQDGVFDLRHFLKGEVATFEGTVANVSDEDLKIALVEEGYTLLSVDSSSDEHVASDDFGDDSGKRGDTTMKCRT